MHICHRCFLKFKPKLIRFKIGNIDGYYVYNYDERVQNVLYQFKGCFDYELAQVFLDYYRYYFFLRYFGYIMIPAPSAKEADEERGFNHVVETFKSLGINMLNIIEKTEKHKQAVSTVNQRREVYKYLELNSHPDLTKKKVLIVDDIYTTGSTMKAAIHLVEKLNPKKISVLVVAKTRGKQLPK